MRAANSPKPLSHAISKAISKANPSMGGRQEGLGLFGVILTLALSTVVAGVGFTVYTHADHARQISLETVNAQQLKQSVEASYAGAPDFTALTNASALTEGVFPKSTLDAMGQPKDTWGGSIQVAAVDVAGNTGQGFAITYENVPTSTCARFAAQGAPGFYDTKINNQSIVDNKVVQTATAINLCTASDSNTVQFIQVKQSPDGPINPTLTACATQPDQSQMAACPAGQISSVSPYGPNGLTQSRSSFCNSVYGTMGWTPWKTVASTCAPICTAPSPSPTSQPLTGSCAGGMAVANTTNTTFPQTQAGTISYVCPAPTGPYTALAPVWGAISPSAASVCAPICSAPAPVATSSNTTGSCPGGQVTSSGATTFAQSRNGSISYSCPSPTGPYTTNATVWGAYSPAPASVCAPKCVAPATQTVYTAAPSTVSHPACPAGYSGSITVTQPRRTTTTTTYSCASPQGSATPSTTASTANFGGATTSNTCVAPPPPPPAPPAFPPSALCGPGKHYQGTGWEIHSASGPNGQETSCQGNSWAGRGRIADPGTPPNNLPDENDQNNSPYYVTTGCVEDGILDTIAWYARGSCVLNSAPPPSTVGTWHRTTVIGGYSPGACYGGAAPAVPAGSCVVGTIYGGEQNQLDMWCVSNVDQEYGYVECY